MVMLDGVAPKNEPIKMNADPVCVKQNSTPQFQETYMVGADGKSLANVFVYVKDGLGNYVYDTPTDRRRSTSRTAATIRTCSACASASRSRSSTAIRRCTTSTRCRRATQEFNNGQPIQGMKMTHTFTAKEVMVPFKCDVHGWMNAYVGVLDHPYFAATDKDGKFELKSLPPGTYTIEAWHEKLGATTQQGRLARKETKEITFTFKPACRGHQGVAGAGTARASKPLQPPARSACSTALPRSSPPARSS